MLTLTYGTKKPETGDRGAVFFPALADNATAHDAHTHDGVTSALILSKNLTRGSVAVDAISWSASGSRYRQTVTVPTGHSLASSVPMFLLNGGTLAGNRIYPDYEKISNTSFYLYMPVNDQAVDCIFT